MYSVLLLVMMNICVESIQKHQSSSDTDSQDE